MAKCSRCSAPMPEERLEVFSTCVGCTDQTRLVGAIEGANKTQVIHIVKAGSEDARRAFNGGTAIIRRNSPQSIRTRKGGV